MGTTVYMTPDELGIRLVTDSRRSPEVVAKAMKFGAIQAKAHLIKKSPVDRGALRNAWQVVALSNYQVTITNDMPYAGVLEYGAKPFRISPEGREAIKQWVIRKLEQGITFEPPGAPRTARGRKSQVRKKLVASRADREEQAEGISWAIAKKLEKKGIKGRKFVQKSMQTIVNLMDREVKKYIDEFFSRPVQRSGKRR